MKTFTRAALAACASAASAAWAHGGHGLPGEQHWHATDAFGLAVVIGGALLAWWLSRGE